jgi:UDP-N-acetylglucosamine 4,6-dehydratase
MLPLRTAAVERHSASETRIWSEVVSVLTGSSILVTGATGSFGRAFLRHALDHLDPHRIVVFSRDELKQYEVRQMFRDDPRLRFFIGDIRDRDRLVRAMHGIDHVVHAAALKQVDTAEYNPSEYVATNIDGSQNVIDAAIQSGVQRVVALSTDKASSPINLYGATKLVADKLFIAGNHYAAHHPTRLAVVRYGNVMGSRGSVVPFFRKLNAEGRSLPVTDKRMTRFWITLDAAVRFVVDSFDMMQGGELFVPRIPSMRILDLVEAVAPEAPTHEVGMRPGEKLHEEMIAADDSRRTLRFPDRYVVQPVVASWGYVAPKGGEPVPDGFNYRSDNNDLWLSVADMRALLGGDS